MATAGKCHGSPKWRQNGTKGRGKDIHTLSISTFFINEVFFSFFFLFSFFFQQKRTAMISGGLEPHGRCGYEDSWVTADTPDPATAVPRPRPDWSAPSTKTRPPVYLTSRPH